MADPPERGGFRSRKNTTDVSRLDAKSLEQVAGFLTTAARELSLSPQQVANTLILFGEGNTLPSSPDIERKHWAPEYNVEQDDAWRDVF